LKRLRDAQATRRVLTQIDRLAFGNAGHSRGVGEGVKELKIDYGPGYRVYYKELGPLLVVLLCGGV
jgi:putative addiction module killer protein